MAPAHHTASGSSQAQFTFEERLAEIFWMKEQQGVMTGTSIAEIVRLCPGKRTNDRPPRLSPLSVSHLRSGECLRSVVLK